MKRYFLAKIHPKGKTTHMWSEHSKGGPCHISVCGQRSSAPVTELGPLELLPALEQGQPICRLCVTHSVSWAVRPE